jgi:hypothetical protein
MAALITLCNQALAQIGASSVQDLDENSIEAREAKRFADPLLAEVADWTEWTWRRTRAVLALTTNDRPAEWLYAYAAPTDMAHPLAIRMEEEALTEAPPFGPYPFPVQDTYPIPFVYEGGNLYNNVENATLIYARSTIDAHDLPPLLQRAFVLELASRIALPIKKDAGIAQAIGKQAFSARIIAIADEENKNPQRTIRYTSDAEYARWGYDL